MDGFQGEHRESVIAFARLLYNGQSSRRGLAELTQFSFENLDDQYREFLRVCDKHLQDLPSWSQPSKLCLGDRVAASELERGITDEGMGSLSTQRNLDWLDLANCDVSDRGIRSLSSSLPMVQLNLEGTRITDAALSHLSQWGSLEELDLSGTAVTDRAIMEIV